MGIQKKRRRRTRTRTRTRTRVMKGLALGSKAATRGAPLVARSRRSSAVASPRVSALEVSCKAKQGQELNGKWCRITGKTANNGFSVSHSHVRTKRLQM